MDNLDHTDHIHHIDHKEHMDHMENIYHINHMDHVDLNKNIFESCIIYSVVQGIINKPTIILFNILFYHI